MGKIEYGWKCPSCGAVMAPWQKSCVNCLGSNHTTTITGNKIIIENPKPVDYEPAPWWTNPAVHWDITCEPKINTIDYPIGSDQITCATTNSLKNALKNNGINI